MLLILLVLLHTDFGDTGTFQHVGEFANMESVDYEDEPYLHLPGSPPPSVSPLPPNAPEAIMPP